MCCWVGVGGCVEQVSAFAWGAWAHARGVVQDKDANTSPNQTTHRYKRIGT